VSYEDKSQNISNVFIKINKTTIQLHILQEILPALQYTLSSVGQLYMCHDNILFIVVFVFIVCSVSFIVCVVLCLFECGVLFV
jgi:hypothetical protein